MALFLKYNTTPKICRTEKKKKKKKKKKLGEKTIWGKKPKNSLGCV
jgi:hypothetical protein